MDELPVPPRGKTLINIVAIGIAAFFIVLAGLFATTNNKKLAVVTSTPSADSVTRGDEELATPHRDDWDIYALTGSKLEKLSTIESVSPPVFGQENSEICGATRANVICRHLKLGFESYYDGDYTQGNTFALTRSPRGEGLFITQEIPFVETESKELEAIFFAPFGSKQTDPKTLRLGFTEVYGRFYPLDILPDGSFVYYEMGGDGCGSDGDIFKLTGEFNDNPRSLLGIASGCGLSSTRPDVVGYVDSARAALVVYGKREPESEINSDEVIYSHFELFDLVTGKKKLLFTVEKYMDSINPVFSLSKGGELLAMAKGNQLTMLSLPSGDVLKQYELPFSVNANDHFINLSIVSPTKIILSDTQYQHDEALIVEMLVIDLSGDSPVVTKIGHLPEINSKKVEIVGLNEEGQIIIAVRVY